MNPLLRKNVVEYVDVIITGKKGSFILKCYLICCNPFYSLHYKMPAGRKRNIKAKSLKSLRNQRYHTKKRKINNTPIIAEDEQRDDDCVIVDNIQN